MKQGKTDPKDQKTTKGYTMDTIETNYPLTSVCVCVCVCVRSCVCVCVFVLAYSIHSGSGVGVLPHYLLHGELYATPESESKRASERASERVYHARVCMYICYRVHTMCECYHNTCSTPVSIYRLSLSHTLYRLSPSHGVIVSAVNDIPTR